MVFMCPQTVTHPGTNHFTAWNSLPDHLHQINDTSLFNRRLKTELFRRAYHR